MTAMFASIPPMPTVTSAAVRYSRIAVETG